MGTLDNSSRILLQIEILTELSQKIFDRRKRGRIKEKITTKKRKYAVSFIWHLQAFGPTVHQFKTTFFKNHLISNKLKHDIDKGNKESQFNEGEKEKNHEQDSSV